MLTAGFKKIAVMINHTTNANFFMTLYLLFRFNNLTLWNFKTGLRFLFHHIFNISIFIPHPLVKIVTFPKLPHKRAVAAVALSGKTKPFLIHISVRKRPHGTGRLILNGVLVILPPLI